MDEIDRTSDRELAHLTDVQRLDRAELARIGDALHVVVEPDGGEPERFQDPVI